MPQVRKDAVQQRIAEAALAVFARDGFPAATMAGIGRAARVSTGNLYRYHDGKEALFDALVPASFAATFLDLLHRRIDSLAGVSDLADLGPDAPFHAAAAELMAFCLSNRRKVVLLLGTQAAGTRHAGFADALVRDLADRALAHFQGAGAGDAGESGTGGETLRFNLDRIYRNWVATLADVLLRYEDETRIRRAVAEFSRYHLAGLKALFEG